MIERPWWWRRKAIWVAALAPCAASRFWRCPFCWTRAPSKHAASESAPISRPGNLSLPDANSPDAAPAPPEPHATTGSASSPGVKAKAASDRSQAAQPAPVTIPTQVATKTADGRKKDTNPRTSVGSQPKSAAAPLPNAEERAAEAKRAMGLQMLSQGKVTEAVSTITEAINQDPNSAEGYLDRCQAYQGVPLIDRASRTAPAQSS